jgi:hypothetical protein
MNILYTNINNNCYNDTNGIIRIDTINFDNTDQLLYLGYDIVWSNLTNEAVLSANKRTVSNLSNGTYSFKIKSLNSTAESDPYIITISSPPELKINNTYSSQYSCGSNGRIAVEIEGGQPPYSYYCNTNKITSLAESVSFDNLPPATYSVSVVDANECLASSNQITILDSSILFELTSIANPKQYNHFASIEFNISGLTGPYDLFIDNTDLNENILSVSGFDTSYLVSINKNTYYYKIDNKLKPGNYKIIIGDQYGCSTTEEFSIPNINPIVSNININPNNANSNIILNQSLPIYDILLIPYKMILENTIEWEHIKKFTTKNHLPIKINDNLYQFTITKNILNKYYISDNQIEILKLGYESKDWFFYLQLAPSINLNTDPTMLDAKISLPIDGFDTNIILGLNDDSYIDSDHISLIRGSLIFSGIIDNQFLDYNCYISLTEDVEDYTNYDFMIKDIHFSINKNMYQAGPVTIISFLNNFNVLNETINIGQTFCNLSPEDYQYIINIKNLLISMNNTNNSIFAYSINNIGTASLALTVSGQSIFIENDGSTTNNNFHIKYFYFNADSIAPQPLYKNNKMIIDEFSIENILDGFFIIKIRDDFNNTPQIIQNNNKIIDVDTHNISAKQIIQSYNSNILSFFEDGDILIFIPSTKNYDFAKTLHNIPTFIMPEFFNSITGILQNVNIFPPTNSFEIIKQTNDETNTASLEIQIFPKETKCILNGPLNYVLPISKDTKIINMIPGVYTLQGDDQDLFSKNLYQNTNRIILDKNLKTTLDIKFLSYKDQIFIKEI